MRLILANQDGETLFNEEYRLSNWSPENSRVSYQTSHYGTRVNGYFWFTLSSLQGLHIAVYHTVSCLLAPANKKEKTDHNLTSHNNSLLRRRLFGSVRRNCLREPPKEKKENACVEGYFKPK